jgi:hypothetical protein
MRVMKIRQNLMPPRKGPKRLTRKIFIGWVFGGRCRENQPLLRGADRDMDAVYQKNCEYSIRQPACGGFLVRLLSRYCIRSGIFV